jgi:D-alanyl-D-alanine carboxypeptidase
MKKAILTLLLAAVTATGLAGLAAPKPVQALSPPALHAEAAALIDVESGRILYSREGDKPMLIASLTKIMTAVVALERGKLTDQVTVSRNAFGKEGSSIYLKLGEQMSLQNMLYGLMLRSGNDAATAIAEHVGGSLDGFVYLMNEKAAELGMKNSHFANPSGLDQDGHYATANDMAKLTAYALQNPTFREIVKTDVKKVPNPTEEWDRVWFNKNKMLTMYAGADGVKTGYTKAAKRCLVSSATRNGQQLAVVTLNDPDDWIDHSRLLDYGFSQFPLKPIVQKGEPVQDGFVAGGSFRYALTEAEAGKVARETVWEKEESVNRRLGLAGKLRFTLDGTTIGEVPLYPAGSPLLKEQDDSAFLFGNGTHAADRPESFRASFMRVMRAVFSIADQG